MKPFFIALNVSLVIGLLSGCTHPLRVTNLNEYRNTTDVSLDHRLKLGISAKAADAAGHRMIHSIGRNLLKYNISSITNAEDNEPVDVLASISVLSQNRGSGWNFWADFPGFLVWYPTLKGYNYHVMYDIDVSLNDAASGEPINRFFVPVRLKIKHADIDRTWVDGVAWPTLGLSALIGGFPHMRYNESVTPLVELETVPVLTDYVAARIATDLRFFRSEPREQLERLRRPGEDLITKDGFDEHHRKIAEDL